MNFKNTFLLLSLLSFLGCGDSNAPSASLIDSANTSGLVGADRAMAAMPGFRSTVIILQNETLSCTGTLIDARLVLTAGHCLANRRLSDLEIVFAANPQRTYQVVASQLHQDYFHGSFSDGNMGRSNLRNDLAILALDEVAPPEAQIAKLATSPAAMGAAVSVRAFGAGRSKGSATDGGFMQSVLLEGSVTEEAPIKISFDQRSGRGFCKGDSGGPLFTIDAEAVVLFGVISSADRWQLEKGRLVGDICEYFGLATQVGAYFTWIEKTKQQLKLRIR